MAISKVQNMWCRPFIHESVTWMRKLRPLCLFSHPPPPLLWWRWPLFSKSFLCSRHYGVCVAHEMCVYDRTASAGRKWCQSPAEIPHSSPSLSGHPERRYCRPAADCGTHLSNHTHTLSKTFALTYALLNKAKKNLCQHLHIEFQYFSSQKDFFSSFIFWGHILERRRTSSSPTYFYYGNIHTPTYTDTHTYTHTDTEGKWHIKTLRDRSTQTCTKK